MATETFAEIATNHTKHPHCTGCGGCLLDPAFAKVHPLWCFACARRVRAGLPRGAQVPWSFELPDPTKEDAS